MKWILLVAIAMGGYLYFFPVIRTRTDNKENNISALNRKLYDAKVNKKVRMGGCPKLDCLLVDRHDDRHWTADDHKKWGDLMDKVDGRPRLGLLEFPPQQRSKVWQHALPLYSNEFVRFADELEWKANPYSHLDDLTPEQLNSVITKELLKRRLKGE